MLNIKDILAMNFERGIGPKRGLRIGIMEKLKREAEILMKKHMFNLCNAMIRKEAEEELEKIMGIPISIEANQDIDGTWNFEIKMIPTATIKKINCEITISK